MHVERTAGQGCRARPNDAGSVHKQMTWREALDQLSCLRCVDRWSLDHFHRGWPTALAREENGSQCVRLSCAMFQETSFHLGHNSLTCSECTVSSQGASKRRASRLEDSSRDAIAESLDQAASNIDVLETVCRQDDRAHNGR